jgi:hypothetical protein
MLEYFDSEGRSATGGGSLSWMEQSALSADKNKLRKLMEKVDHSQIAYEPLRKDFYVEAPEIGRMTDDEVKEYDNVLHFRS